MMLTVRKEVRTRRECRRRRGEAESVKTCQTPQGRPSSRSRHYGEARSE